MVKRPSHTEDLSQKLPALVHIMLRSASEPLFCYNLELKTENHLLWLFISLLIAQA